MVRRETRRKRRIAFVDRAMGAFGAVDRLRDRREEQRAKSGIVSPSLALVPDFSDPFPMYQKDFPA